MTGPNDPDSNEFGNDATDTSQGSDSDEALLNEIKEEMG